jgi:hypothetical protein
LERIYLTKNNSYGNFLVLPISSTSCSMFSSPNHHLKACNDSPSSLFPYIDWFTFLLTLASLPSNSGVIIFYVA